MVVINVLIFNNNYFVATKILFKLMADIKILCFLLIIYGSIIIIRLNILSFIC